MSHYLLHLAAGQQADVHQGMIVKKTISFRWKRGASDKKRAYIIQVGPKVYHLLRAMDGTWLTEGVGNFQPTGEDALSHELRQAIQEYENNH